MSIKCDECSRKQYKERDWFSPYKGKQICSDCMDSKAKQLLLAHDNFLPTLIELAQLCWGCDRYAIEDFITELDNLLETETT